MHDPGARSVFAWLGLVLIWGSGCRDEPTQTWVFVHAPLALAPDADRLRVTIEAAGAQVVMREDPVSRDRELIANLFLVPRGGDASRTWEIHAELLEGESTAAHLRVAGGYEAGETRVVHAHFTADEACLAAGDCGAGRTCQGGRCVGACFADGGEVDDEVRHLARCSECERCSANRCEPLADGTECGCAGDVCQEGVCEPREIARQVWTGRDHACARTGSALWCWGNARTDQTTFQSSTDRPRQVEDARLNRSAIDMALAREFSCALWVASGAVYGRTCWGWASAGGFAMGPLEGVQPLIEEVEPTDDSIADIQAGFFFQCALRESGRLQCAGSNDSNQLAQPDTVADADEWVEVPGTYESMSVGGSTVCAIDVEGPTWCWGLSAIDSTIRSPALECVRAEDGECFEGFRQVATGSGRACALDGEDRVWCWGGNVGGILGVVGPERVTYAMPVDTEVRFASLAASDAQFCGIARDGGLWCWGANGNGELGVGGRQDVLRPARVQVDADDRWLRVSLGGPYTCAVRSDDQLYCWGSNGGAGVAGSWAAGRLGLGLGTDGSDPADRGIIDRPRRVCFDPPG